MIALRRILPFFFGVAMTLNFALFWAVPVAGAGVLWKNLFKPILMPMYDVLDKSTLMRSFATSYIYSKPEHADFFAVSLLLITNSVISLGVVFYWQLTTGSLPAWLIFAYLCSWVGIGGRVMGGAYALAHKEVIRKILYLSFTIISSLTITLTLSRRLQGHNHGLYKKWIRDSLGNMFENWLGLFFGNIPYNFSTSHVFIHHRLDGGPGDTFYEWDLDRTNLAEFMLYITRVSKHMVGYSSLKLFAALNQTSKYDKLFKGVVVYWATAACILAVTRSPSFVFWIYLQPLMCMTYFLAMINYGFHGFLEFDENGKSVPCVDATTIIDGDDDYFGEDDHMAHHYNASVYFRDLPTHQKSKIEEWKKYKASVFRGCSIVELSIFVLFGLWDELANHYVDYTGTMTRDEIKAMLKARAKRRQSSHESYEAYVANPTLEAREKFLSNLNTTDKPSEIRKRPPLETSLKGDSSFVDMGSSQRTN